ncbi:S-methyl-5'-thioadenosine phosphorylase [Endozoicomonas sp. ONNA2]|uniref:S-methyl-5'-thioadenosine phosphorylase n=1 Tax=Endozoicomonas sp. ONNA2 TaxID=2828741 RepID=UPI0021492B55|nr:S-methyl-5'-thioadenosine phosphorylase [Endozoicomonas sp. ONNA2]
MLAIIGGTGLYDVEGLELVSEEEVDTPFGTPSAPLSTLKTDDREILFLPRHGKGHSFLPHEINYRANMYALKQAGARMVLGFSAVGSLREEIAPGDFSIPSQYLDLTKGKREATFFGNGIAAHVSTAVPTCPALSGWVKQVAQEKAVKLHMDKTYACVEGPRLGTKAESFFMRRAGCDLVGMTNVPEVFLAREAQLAYATICIATDYDCWLDDPDQHVTVQAVIPRFNASLAKARELLMALLALPLPTIDEDYRKALEMAVLTPDSALNEEQLAMLEVLRA